jgi:hypothetical protein
LPEAEAARIISEVRWDYFHQEEVVTSRSRFLLFGLLFAVLAIYAPLAQQKLNLPIQQEPGQPKKVVLPEAPVPETVTAAVVPGPEPWYTVFGTGEVVGYIEPCG